MACNKIAALLAACFLSVSVIIGGCGNIKDKQVSISEKYPAKPVTIIVPTTAGGNSPDIIARVIAKVALKHLGQSLVVTNIPGEAATLGWNALAGAKPDGYTIGVVATGIILQPLYGPTQYHYPTALEPLVQITSSPIAAVVRVNQSWQNIHDLVQYAKEHPGEIKFGHMGLGSPTHIVGEMFALDADINIKQVLFSEKEELPALLDGQIQLIFAHTSVIKDNVENGKVRVLAVATEQRLSNPVFADVPTFKEQGLDVVFNLWLGIATPKGLPAYEKARLLEELRKIVTDPEFKQNMENFGMPVDYLGPHEFRRKWLIDNAELADNERLTKIIKKARIPELIEEQKNNNPKEFF